VHRAHRVHRGTATVLLWLSRTDTPRASFVAKVIVSLHHLSEHCLRTWSAVLSMPRCFHESLISFRQTVERAVAMPRRQPATQLNSPTVQHLTSALQSEATVPIRSHGRATLPMFHQRPRRPPSPGLPVRRSMPHSNLSSSGAMIRWINLEIFPSTLLEARKSIPSHCKGRV